MFNVAGFQRGPHMWNIFQLKSEVISGTRMRGNRPREKNEGGKGDEGRGCDK